MLYADILNIIGEYSSFKLSLDEDNELEIRLEKCDICNEEITYTNESKIIVYAFPFLWKIDPDFFSGDKYIDRDRLIIKCDNLFYTFDNAVKENLIFYFGRPAATFIYGSLMIIDYTSEIYVYGKKSLHVFTRELSLYLRDADTNINTLITKYRDSLEDYPKDVIINVCKKINVNLNDIPILTDVNSCEHCKTKVHHGDFFI